MTVLLPRGLGGVLREAGAEEGRSHHAPFLRIASSVYLVDQPGFPFSLPG
jgi:hypothetical protein